MGGVGDQGQAVGEQPPHDLDHEEDAQDEQRDAQGAAAGGPVVMAVIVAMSMLVPGTLVVFVIVGVFVCHGSVAGLFNN